MDPSSFFPVTPGKRSFYGECMRWKEGCFCREIQNLYSVGKYRFCILNEKT